MFGYTVEKHVIGGEEIKFAKWLHPGQGPVTFDNGFFSFMGNYIKDGDVVIDIGPHVGFQTLMYGLHTGKNGKVFAFEPNPWVFEAFEASCKMNCDKMNIIPFCLAAMESDGEYVFHYSDMGYCNGGLPKIEKFGHTNELVVSGVNVCNFLNREYPEDYKRVAFIKTDTEGHDLSVLYSLDRIIIKNRPIVQSEIFLMSSVEDVQKQLEFFYDLNYVTYFMPEQKQSALGNTDLFTLYDKRCTPDMARWLKSVSGGEDILSIPKERMWL